MTVVSVALQGERRGGGGEQQAGQEGKEKGGKAPSGGEECDNQEKSRYEHTHSQIQYNLHLY